MWRAKIQAGIGRDRLSELPDPIILRILSHLPSTKERARTAVLSKRWRWIWHYLPTVCFNEGWFLEGTGLHGPVNQRIEFDLYVDGFMARLRENKLSIDKFELELTTSGRDRYRLVDKWMKIASECSVEVIWLRNCSRGLLDLPASILSAKSLKSLNICGMAFPDQLFSGVSLDRLRQLYLFDVLVKEQVLQSIVANCPALEELCLFSVVDGVGKLQFTNRLKHMRILACPGIRPEYEVDAPNVEKLTVANLGLTRVTSLSNLRILRVKPWPTCESFLNEVIPRLPRLEVLRVWACRWLQRLEFRSSSIRDIQLKYRSNLEVIEIDVPAWYTPHYQVSHPPEGSSPRVHLHYYGAGNLRSYWFIKRSELALSTPSSSQLRVFYVRACPYTMIFPEVLKAESNCCAGTDFRCRIHHLKDVINFTDAVISPRFPPQHIDHFRLKFYWSI